MKKRIVFIIALAVVALYCSVDLIMMAKRGRWYITGDEPREWARQDYDRIFRDPLVPLPTIATAPAKESVEIDVSNSNSVTFKWPTPENDMDLIQFGERVQADPETAVAVLPNGQKVSFLGFDYWKPTSLEKGDTYQRMSWRDPVTLRLMEDPQARGLSSTLNLDHGTPYLCVAFRCEDAESRPVLWQGMQTRYARMLTHFNGSTRIFKKGDIKHYNLKMIDTQNQNAPVDLCVSLSFGPTESVVVSPTVVSDASPARFPSGAADISLLFSSKVDYLGYHGDGHIGKFHWSSSRKTHSLFIFRNRPAMSWPITDARTWRTDSQDPDTWDEVKNYGRLASFCVETRLEDLREIEVRRYPGLAHCVFRLAGISDLPENLFATKCGPVRFKTDSDLIAAIERATGTEIQLANTFDSLTFPMEFESVTPAQLLDLIEAKTGTKYYLDRKNHRITWQKPPTLLKRFKQWLAKCGIGDQPMRLNPPLRTGRDLTIGGIPTLII